MRLFTITLASLLATSGFVMAGMPTWARAQDAPVIGSRDVAIADPALPRPGSKPCVVSLFPKTRFGRHGDSASMHGTPHTFQYTPPSRCDGPWAKVVLEADFSVAAGHQYDRTASIWLDGVNLYFGTTEEPSPGVARRWHVERDLTDYASLLRHAGSVDVLINNWIGPVFSSPIFASARLLIYPADAAFPAPTVPDRIYALNRKDTTPAKIDKSHPSLSRQIVFPRNTTRVYLDLFAEPQAHDEFYYVCLPEATIARVGTPGSNGSLDRSQTCNGGTFREVMVRIDGVAAGLAPVAPWVFTGGLDPFLWQPTPGAEALNFLPYRVDLSPFAGQLADGKPHTVAIEVLGHPNFFSVAGALLVYEDPHAAHTGGAVTVNTLQGTHPAPVVADQLVRGAHGVDGGITTRANQHYVIEGYVDTADGRVRSRVETTIAFGNTQKFLTRNARSRRHGSWQSAHVDSTSTTTGAVARPRSLHRVIDYALDARTLSGRRSDTHLQRAVELRQRFARHLVQRTQGLPPFVSNMSNTHLRAGQLDFERGKRLSYKSRNQSSMQSFRYSNSLGDCYQATVQARDRKVTGYAHGLGCVVPGVIHWYVHPDGSPDSFGWRSLMQPAAASPQTHPRTPIPGSAASRARSLGSAVPARANRASRVTAQTQRVSGTTMASR